VGTAFRVLSGGRVGTVFTPSGDSFVAGRHESADLRFDRQHDMTVSAKHAQFERSGDEWIVRDLGSRNGTIVNGSAIAGEARLRRGDRVTFGAGGPELELVAGDAVAESPTARVRVAVQRERRRSLIVAGVAIAVVLPLALGLAASRSRNSAWARERAEMEHRIDSLLAAGKQAPPSSLMAQVSGLSSALRQSESELQRLRDQLHSTSAGDDATDLRRDVIAATAALRRQQLAASLDFAAIQRRARGAVAMIWVEFPGGRRATGTAFAVRANGTLLTNRHVVSSPAGDQRPSRIAVRFADSDQAFPARLVSVSRDWELAVIKVDNVIGDVPSVAGFNLRPDTLAAGAPVALIGYPLGGEPEKDPAGDRRIARPIVSAALILRLSPQAIEVQGLGAAGASGSPILDASGELVAILYGGRTEQGVQILLGVPARTAADFLATVP
jgi:hypothetical protein